MRAASLVIALTSFVAFAACGGKPGKSICDNTVPAPAACMSQCDPSPSAANTCPSGYHCAADGFCDALCTPSGGECGDGYICTTDGRCKGEDECEGIECNISECQKMGMPDTSISGTIYAPNGTLPLYGITVYVPNQPVPPMTDGAQCARCSDTLPGAPLTQTTTNEEGKFTLTGNVPDGPSIPLVITSGKWRRQIMIPNVGKCTDTPLTDAQQTRLPKDKSEGDIPKIALTTGDADSLECLIRKLGIADSEITNSSGTGRVHFFHGDGVGKFNATFAGGPGQSFSNSNTLWNSANTLKAYDIVILSCEGAQMDTTKQQSDLNAMKEYADIGGRVFASHWNNIWVGGYWHNGGNDNGNFNTPNPAIADWRPLATWGGNDPGTGTIDVIDEQNNAKGTPFANWMKVVEPGNARGEIPIINGTQKSTVVALPNNTAERWTYIKGTQTPQNFQFTTPTTAAADQRCGKVVFSDMHVSGGPQGGDYPDSCANANTFTAQEKALAFMLFDLASCISVIF